MRNGLVASLLVVAILAGAGAGYLVGVSSVANSTSQNSVATTSCTVAGPTIGAVIRVIESSGPVAGARVSGEADGYCNNALQTQTLQSAVTNSSGWVSLMDGGFGVYNLLVSFEVGNPPLTQNYHLSISMQPTAVTYVVFDTVTGNVTTHICYYNLHCFVGA
jgi:hypothetical protein